jgi:protein-tyrosine phosphatase
VSSSDFLVFDHIVGLDAANLAELRAMEPQGAKAKLSLLLDHAEGGRGSRWRTPIMARMQISI